MNPLHTRLITGVTGELLVQLRLFQYGVQAAAPLEDSGNDLIAVRGSTFRAIQVKTKSENGRWNPPGDRAYHLLALVRLRGTENNLFLDECEIFLIASDIVRSDDFRLNDPPETSRLSQDVVDILIPNT